MYHTANTRPHTDTDARGTACSNAGANFQLPPGHNDSEWRVRWSAADAHTVTDACGSANTGINANPHADASTHTNPDACPVADTHANTDTDSRADTHPDSTHASAANADAHTDASTHASADTPTHAGTRSRDGAGNAHTDTRSAADA